MDKENFKLKCYYDPLFDDIFFSKDFINYVLENKGYCPKGLTFDTKFDEDGMYFNCCCKEYGYEYSGERVVNDFILIHSNVDMEDYAALCFKYLKKVKPEIANKIKNYDICY